MKPSPSAEWCIQTEVDAIGRAPTDSMLVLRLGLAVNALRAQHRFSNSVHDLPGPAGMRDRAWAFIQAVAFTREGLNILTGTGAMPRESKRVKELAIAGGAAPELVTKMGQLEGGSHAASPILSRVRNQLAFHWDPSVLWPWLAEIAGTGKGVVWTEGVGKTNGETVHRAGSDALLNAITPAVPGTDVSPDVRLADAMPGIVDAMTSLAAYFECSIAAFLKEHGGAVVKLSSSAL